VASLFLHSAWEHFPSIAWAAPTFDFPENMPETDNGQTIAAAASTQLCPYDEEEQGLWCRLTEAQFTAGGVKSQKLKYAKAFGQPAQASPSGHLDTVDVCNDSGHPFDLLKDVLLGQFGKSKWQSYFELLWLPMEM
jgi:hypothetical protein